MEKLILLPGMDGTGELFSEFIAALPATFSISVASYPNDRYLSFSELETFVRTTCPASAPFVLLAESFSTPLAIRFAASKPANLKGLVLCAGFATSPVSGWRRFVGRIAAPFISLAPLPHFAARRWLVGKDASPRLLKTLRTVVSSVPPRVLGSRLRAVFACDVRAEFGRISLPALYLQAKRDRLVDARCLDELRAINSQMTVAEIEGPHLLLQREPQLVAEEVARFVRSLPIF